MRNRDRIEQVRADRSGLIAALAKAGAKIKGKSIACPFHEDVHPSAGIFSRNGVWAFKCHGCGFTGDVFDVICKARGCDFKEALNLMGLDGETDIERLPSRNGKAASPRSDQTKSRADPVRLANESHKRLLGDPAALAHLSSTRGVDKATAERFRVGITGKIGNRFWTFPIPGPDGNVIAVKAHRADGQDQKSWWSPEGVNRNHVWPVSIQGPGPVWVCSGELKALAVISTGRSAIGITSGEGSSRTPCDLPAAALQLLAGKSCALAPDDDECGEAWGRHVLRQMAQAAIDCREVNLGLDKAAGLKDIGDFIVRLYENGKSPDEVA